VLVTQPTCKLQFQFPKPTYLFAFCIQGRGGLIQQQDAGLPYEGSGNSDALLLTTRELSSFGSHTCIVFLNKETKHQRGFGPDPVSVTLQLCFHIGTILGSPFPSHRAGECEQPTCSTSLGAVSCSAHPVVLSRSSLPGHNSRYLCSQSSVMPLAVLLVCVLLEVIHAAWCHSFHNS